MAVPDAGLSKLLEFMFGVTAGGTPYVAAGTSATGFDAGDTTLGAELSRVVASTVSVTDNVVTIKAFFNTSEANGAVAETGLLTASSGGTLLDRSIETPAQVKDSSKEMIVEYAITLARG